MSKENEMRATGNLNRKSSAESMDQEMREQIEKRAYELFEARGAEPGHELEDWVRAESEIVQQTRPQRAA
ncbi:MAG TPA: DUF2934 domain-containing protein [Candidatus Methylomirabilis sp.]|nr:DUF2934 domain-containing protein [Candidatus Methylomirabilis sp.]